MSTPTEQQPQGTTDPASANMVRVCDRCGTVCSTDQEWCLNCGVRMTEATQGLPGLRAAGLVVALAVLLAGGAAAASYAALRGDARSAANVPADTTGAPVAQAPPATAPVAPVAPVAPAATTPTTSTTTSTAKKPATPAAPAAPAAPAPAAPATPPATGGGGGSTGGSTGGGSTGGSTGGGGGGSTTTTPTTTTPREPTSGPVVFASGQGTIYDPAGHAANKGEEGNAIDGSTGSSWKVVLNEGQSGGLGYVLDFDDATALKRLTVNTSTAGLKIKVLGTTKSALPPDELDSNWDTIASERTMKSGRNAVPLKAVSGAKSKYRHVLVLFTSIPGDPATAVIREFTASS